VIPPPPHTSRFADPHFTQWVDITYAPGTPVKLLRPKPADGPADARGDVLPAGTRGAVTKVVHSLRMVMVDWYPSSSLPRDATSVVRWDDIEHTIEPLVDNWPSHAPMKRTSLPASQRGVSMKHRRLKPNSIPAPPPDTTSRHFFTWVVRTFPVGSAFRMGSGMGGVLYQVEWIQTGVTSGGRVYDGKLHYYVVPGLRDQHGTPHPEADAVVGPGKLPPLNFDKLRDLYLNGDVRPVVDHWAPLQGAPTSMKHRRLLPNTIPPAPGLAHGYKTIASASYGAWVERTYQPGTRVAFPKGIATLVGWLPPGARGVVESVHTTFDPRGRTTDAQRVFVRVTDARDAAGPLSQFAGHVMQIDSLYYPAAGLDMSLDVVPLDDNWGAAAPLKRTSLPASQRGVSMKHRRLMPNKRTSRRVRPNTRYLHASSPQSAQKIIKSGWLKSGFNRSQAHRRRRSVVYAATHDVPPEQLKDWFVEYYGWLPSHGRPTVVDFETNVDPDEVAYSKTMKMPVAAWFKERLKIHSPVLRNRRTSKKRTSRGKR
jgi:hypothetical protein